LSIRHHFAAGPPKTPPHATEIRLLPVLGAGPPDDLDYGWYFEQARREVQKTPGYRHRARALLRDHPAALDLFERGLAPIPKWGKGHRLKWAIRGLILVDTSMGRVPPVRWDERYVLAPVGSPHAPIIRRDLDRQCRRRALGTLGRCLAPSRGGRL
ncbi:MAG TPA: hypothetical protein VFJ92_02960, partial [Gemmatimonadales bacterium]|nr:hypothetical protein [Gemmatimonadales bacterium]